ncbi:recombinase family protein [Peribacillus butanolivorans]|uniref:recombinase family protein n=1 Tax=Peribacillus butanolivorans TaxID=421767 RepID=UPI0039FCE611
MRVQEGDTIVVTKLDRFARSTKDALNTIEYLNIKGVSLILLKKTYLVMFSKKLFENMVEFYYEEIFEKFICS